MRVKVAKSMIMMCVGDDKTVVGIQRGRIEHVGAYFKYIRCLVNYIGTKKVERKKKVMNGRRVSGIIEALVNKKKLSLNCVSVLDVSLLIPTLMYEHETMVWEE